MHLWHDGRGKLREEKGVQIIRMKIWSRKYKMIRGVRNVLLCAVTVVCLGIAGMTAHAATGTVTAESAMIRSKAGISGEKLAGVVKNDTLDVISKTTGEDGNTWYQVHVNGSTKGYIRADLVTVSGDVATASGTTEEAAGMELTAAQTDQSTETTATVTESSVTSATVSKASINVRKGPATTDAIVAGNIKQGTVLSVTGETTGSDGKLWYQVSFESNGSALTGFVRYDIVDVSTPEPTEEEPAEETPETQAPEEPEAGGAEINRVITSRILPEGANIADMTIDESTLQSWQAGRYYLLYLVNPDGSKEWYLYDLDSHIFNPMYQRTEGDAGGEAAGTDSGSGFGTTAKIIVAILAVIVVILIGIIVLLVLKLRNQEEDWDDYGDEDDDDEEEEDEADSHVNSRAWRPRNFLRSSDEEEEDEEEDEDEDEDEEEEIPKKRPVRRAQPRQEAPARRRVESGERTAAVRRRPEGEPVRRQPSAEAVRRQPEGGAVRRRPEEGAAPRRRPEGEPVRRQPSAEAARRQPEGGAVRRRPEGEAVRRRSEDEERGGAVRRRPEPAQGSRRRAESAEEPRRRPEPQAKAPARRSLYEEDDEFEFEFLNMDGKDDL